MYLAIFLFTVAQKLLPFQLLSKLGDDTKDLLLLLMPLRLSSSKTLFCQMSEFSFPQDLESIKSFAILSQYKAAMN